MTLTPLRADDACDFTGINSRIAPEQLYPDSNWGTTWPLLRELNIRHIRFQIGWKGLQGFDATEPLWPAGSYSPDIDNATLWVRAGSAWGNLGIKSLISIGGIYTTNWGGLPNPGGSLNPPGTFDHIDQARIDGYLNSIKNNYVNNSYGDCVFAIEGQNEYSTSVSTASSWGPRVNLYQQTIANRRNALGLGSKLLVMPSMWPPHNVPDTTAVHSAFGNVYWYANYGNLHFYPDYATVSDNLAANVNIVRDYSVFNGVNKRKVIVSEFGTHTIPGYSTQRAQAKNIARYVCEMMSLGTVEKAYNYALMDQPNNVYPAQRDWGLIATTYTGPADNPTWTSYTKKEGFYALRNFLGLLEEANWNLSTKNWDRASFTPEPLTVDFDAVNAGTKSLAFQKADGTYYIMLWRDVTVLTTGGADINNYEDGIGVSIRKCAVSTKVRRPLAHNADWNYHDRGTGTYGITATGLSSNKYRRVTFTVPDYVIALEVQTADGFFTTSYTSGNRNDFTGNVGYEFVPNTNISVKALGRPEATNGGMNSSHTVTIWRTNGTVAASAVVTTSSPIDENGNRYTVLASPVTLTSGTTYRITTSENSGGDRWLQASSGNLSSHLSNATITKAVYAVGSGYPSSTWGGTNSGYAAPVFYE